MAGNKSWLLPIAAGFIFCSSLLGVLVGFETPVGTLRLIDLSFVFWIVAFLPRIWKEFREKPKKFILFTLAFVWLTGTTIFLSAELISGLAYILRWSVGLIAAWSLSLWLREQGKKTQTWIDLWAVAWVSLGILQYLLFPDARVLFWSGWDDHLFRAFGSVLDPLFYGLTSSVIAWRGYRRWIHSAQFGHWVLILGILGVVLSYSRLAALATLGWLLLESFSWKRIKQTALVAGLLLALILLSPKDGGGEGQKLLRTSTLSARSDAAQQDVEKTPSLQMLLVGEGWYFRPANANENILSHAQIADSLWLQIWLSSGVIGITGILATALYLNPRSKLVWWHIFGSSVSLLSLSPWILVASAVVGDDSL